jgi:hypothetical protein
MVTVVRSLAANNRTGIAASSALGTLRLGRSAVTGNALSWSTASSGVLASYGDNYINGNGDGDPAPATIARK